MRLEDYSVCGFENIVVSFLDGTMVSWESLVSIWIRRQGTCLSNIYFNAFHCILVMEVLGNHTRFSYSLYSYWVTNPGCLVLVLLPGSSWGWIVPVDGPLP